MNFIVILQFPFLTCSNFPFMVDLAGLNRCSQTLAVCSTTQGAAFHDTVFHFKTKSPILGDLEFTGSAQYTCPIKPPPIYQNTVSDIPKAGRNFFFPHIWSSVSNLCHKTQGRQGSYVTAVLCLYGSSIKWNHFYEKVFRFIIVLFFLF